VVELTRAPVPFLPRPARAFRFGEVLLTSRRHSFTTDLGDRFVSQSDKTPVPKEGKVVSIFSWLRVRLVAILVTLVDAFAVAPAPAGAWSGNHGWRPTRTYGATSLVLDPAAAQALSSLGVTPGLINPACAANGALNFPIKTPLYAALAASSATRVVSR
jgi:hypothetical protein